MKTHRLHTITAKCFAIHQSPHTLEFFSMNVLSSLPTHFADVSHDLVMCESGASRVYCVTFPTYFSNHKEVAAINE
ncbi:hypothetical protein MRX96_057228 [Rhipicephalus microplus]